MKVGPEIVTDNLVFGYDTGYPSATNAQSLRFNKGEPTVNISSTHHAYGHNSGNYGNDVTVVDAPEKGDGWKKVTIKNLTLIKIQVWWVLPSVLHYYQPQVSINNWV